MKLDALIRSIETVAVGGPASREIVGVVCDSRQVRPGALFVAVHGASRDGAAYIEDALQRGAAAVVSEHPLPARKEACHIQVRDARAALASLACEFHNHPADSLQMVGITGTNGKTTTAYMTRDILRAAGRNPGLLTTVEYEIGTRAIPAGRTTPDAPTLQAMLAQMVSKGCLSAVMEVSSHALDQRRAAGIDFDVAVFTNLGRDHLDYHHTREEYFAAKRLLFARLGEGRKHAAALINADDPWGQRLLAMVNPKARTLTFGHQAAADVRAEDIRLQPDQTLFRARTPWGTIDVGTQFLGRYNVSNALAAIGAAGALGVPVERMAPALRGMLPVPGRLQEFRAPQGFQVFVDYAHTDDALANVLGTLRDLTRGRLIAVFGCGGNRDVTKRDPMGAVAAKLADYSILTSDNPRREDPASIIAQIRAGFGSSSRFEIIEDRAEAIHRAVRMAQAGDVVLVAGKGHETFQEFATTTVPFDDRAVVEKEIASL